ncbi:hypothetical protein AGMMS49941_13060 [Deferribacterales bacterium]|nr:hypothetical protein AGMMS49941_13060 [Deferribacterales bacterium]
MAFQQYVELDSDRYIVKTGAGAKIVVNAGGKASDKYRRLSFVISGLTDYTEAVPVMTYSDSAGNKQQTEFSSFFNGNNCSDRLKVGKWTTFEVLPNTYAHINIEKVYLSRYSMLPNSFIPLFLLFSAVVVTILYLFLYKGVYNKLEKLRFSNCILVAVIIVAQLGVIAYHTKHKTYLEIDEVWAYQLANDQSDNKQVVFDEWHFGRYYLEKLTAQRGEGWQQYKQILDIPKNDDWSAPSLPFLQLHFVSSMFPDTYSIWLGVAVNMLYFVGTCLVLFFISRLLLPDRLALLPLLLWGFSGAAIGIETYTRVYAMSTFFYILLVYVAMCIVKNTCTTSALDGGGGLT